MNMTNSKNYISVRVGGVTLRMTSDLPEEIEALKAAFRHHIVPQTSGSDEEHEIIFRGSSKRVVPQECRKVWQGIYHAVGKSGMHDNIVTKYRLKDDTKEYYETADGECIITNLETMTTECVLKERTHLFHKGRERSQVGSLLILMMHTVMSYHRRYSLHASCVTHKGKAILFTGRSGQGKSTISTDLAALGAGFMGDDIVFIYRENGELKVGSLLFEAKLFKKGDNKKSFVDIVSLYNGEVLESLPLGGFCEINKKGTGDTEVIPIENREEILPILLNAANNIAMQYDKHDWIETCAQLMMDYELKQVLFGDRAKLSRDFMDKITG